MRALPICIAALSLLAATAAQPFRSVSPVAGGATACLGPDEQTESEIAYLRRMTGSTNPLDVAWRQRIPLPAALPSEIALVSDSATCARALTAYNTRANEEGVSVTGVYVIAVKDMYVVSNPQLKAGEFLLHYVFDSAFTFRRVYGR
jgi:hypothetical protein